MALAARVSTIVVLVAACGSQPMPSATKAAVAPVRTDAAVPAPAPATTGADIPLPEGALARLGPAGCHIADSTPTLHFLDEDRLIVLGSRSVTVTDAVTCAVSAALDVSFPALSPDGGRLVHHREDGALEILDLRGDDRRVIRDGLDGLDYELAVSDDGTVVAAGIEDKPCVRVWRADAAARDVCRDDVKDDWGLDFALDADGARLHVDVGEWLTVYATDSGRELERRAAPDEHILLDGDPVEHPDRALDPSIPVNGASRIAFSPSGARVAVSLEHGIRAYDAATGAELTALRPADVHRAAFERDGTSVVTASSTGIQRWDATTGALLETLAPGDPAGQMLEVWQRGDGHWAWVAEGKDGTVSVHDGEHTIALGNLGFVGTLYHHVAIAPDDRHVAVVEDTDARASVVIVDLTSRSKKTVKLAGKHGEVREIAYTPDGASLVVAVTGKLFVVDAATRKVAAPIAVVNDEQAPLLVLRGDGASYQVSGERYDLATGKATEERTGLLASARGLELFDDYEYPPGRHHLWISRGVGDGTRPADAAALEGFYRPVTFDDAGHLLACDWGDCVIAAVPVD
jgi:DNA-binding beta-propeller fold protein YncE